ncbi:YEATS domain-containing protein 4-like [Uloborus diversus]|uniref:YEATS domain-containing protein 4-like n=1 Tax=Uloborus diversus TaxID=327109 RepID=UPI002409DA41|nr:YEATS domain-containing protein 4-like [Uloborus diversus]
MAAASSRGPSGKAVGAKAGSGNEATRLKGLQIIKPIIYGNVAWFLGKKREEDGHTHQWTVYLRPYDNEDMSVYVKRVHFKLHESYSEPNRVCHQPPYTITETGWGEFEIAIKVFFQDSNERPVTLYHFLKLFDREKDGSVKVGAGPVDSEFYDELVFSDPTIKMHRLLTHPKPSASGPTQHKTDYEEKKVVDLKKVMVAREEIKKKIAETKAELLAKQEEISKLKLEAKLDKD